LRDCPITIFAILCALGLWMWLHSRIKPIGHHNVNDDWEAPDTPAALQTEEVAR